MSVIVETTMGDITIDLYVKERPRSCLNFLKLCKIKYYNYCIFHSVQRNFVAQAGDPTGTGRGGESIFRMLYGDQAKFFNAEKIPKIKHSKTGQISMVNNGNDCHGSQFLLTLNEGLDSLDGIHTVFGEVAEGMDVLLKISEAFCDKTNRPYQDIRITHTVILDDPLNDPQGLMIPDQSPEPTKEQIDGCLRIGAEESLEDDEGLAPEEVVLKEEKKDASHRAQVLEIIGDLPDKDVKPPDNVLFVCKLNSITTDEDLEIIFSRFGTILSCEIIRDFKSGESLQYAFIEFEEAEMCEKAYHKMDNVLIDDRRIHVDFSQSVSKFQFPNVKKFSNNKEKDLERRNKQEMYSNEENKIESERNFDDNDDDRRSNKRKRRGYESPKRSHDYNSHERSRDYNSHERSRDYNSHERSRDYNSHERSRDSVTHQRSSEHDFRKRLHDYDSKTVSNDLKAHKQYASHENSHQDFKKRSHYRESPKRDRNSSHQMKKSREYEMTKKSRSLNKSPKRSRSGKSKKHKKQAKSSGSEIDDSFSEEEVRCGKHKKRDVSQHKHKQKKRDRS